MYDLLGKSSFFLLDFGRVKDGFLGKSTIFWASIFDNLLDLKLNSLHFFGYEFLNFKVLF